MTTAPPPDDPPARAPVAGDAAWRLEVGRTRAAHLRRALPFTVNLGHPSADRVSREFPWPVPQEFDAGLRFDAVDALVEQWQDERSDGAAQVSGWLTRPGSPSVHDEDLLWYAAAAHVCSARAVRLVTFRAVTHTGWYDVVTGRHRTWRRLRI